MANLPKRHIAIILVLIAAGTWLRFAALSTIPALEHDEALICLGARNIAFRDARPLTGDKVYEGPFLEYLIGAGMVLGGPESETARNVMALAGILAIIVTGLAGWICGTPRIGFIAAILTVFAPWYLAAARVIYGCNLSTVWIPVWIIFSGLYFKKPSTGFVVAGAAALGFAANGRITACILLVPALMLIGRCGGHRRRPQMAIYTATALLLSLPVIIFNFRRDFPALDVLMGSGQGHFLSSIQEIPGRILGYAASLQMAFTGQNYWLDASVPGFPWLLLTILPAAAGLFYAVTRPRHCDRWLVASWLGLMLLLPMVTKSSGTGFLKEYHPHYMDLTMPFLILFIARGIDRLIARQRTAGYSFLALIVLLQGLMLSVKIIPDILENGPPGRWNNNFRTLARRITASETPESVIVYAPWQFQAGFPQMSFFLSEYEVYPIIGQCFGYLMPNNAWKETDVIHISRNPHLYRKPWVWFGPGAPEENASGYWKVASPGIRLNGMFYSDASADMCLISTWNSPERPWPRMLLAAGGAIHILSIENRTDRTTTVPAMQAAVENVTDRHRRNFERMSRWTVAHHLTGTGSLGPWRMDMASSDSKGGTRSVQLQIGDAPIDGHFTGTAVFY